MYRAKLLFYSIPYILLLPAIQRYNCSLDFEKHKCKGLLGTFIAWHSLCISSALNAIIYHLRARRCCSVFKQFLKDTVGSSDFKENPNGRRNGGNPTREDIRIAKYIVVKGGDVLEVERQGSQTRQEHSKKRRNGTVISSLDDPEADHGVGCVRGYKEEKGLKSGKACVEPLSVEFLPRKRRANAAVKYV